MEHKLTLIFGKNGSVEVINEGEESYPWGELTSLGLMLVTSTALNLSFVTAETVGRAKGTVHIAPLLTAVCWSNVLDTTINHSLALTFLSYWPDSNPPPILCRISSFTYIFFLLLQPLYVATQLFHVLFIHKRSVSLLLLFPPLTSSALTIFIFVFPDYIKVRHFINRHVCGITGENLVYSGSLVVFGFLFTWATIVYCLLVRRFTCCMAHQFSGEDRDFRCVLALVILSLLLVLPATSSFSVMSVTHLNNLSTYKFSENNIVVFTGIYDTVFTWLKFSFNFLSPLLIFVFYKDLWHEFFQLLLHIKTMTVCSFSSQTHDRQSNNTVSQGGPVLFVSSKGLVLMKPSANGRSPLDQCDLMDPNQSISDPPSISGNQQPSSASSVSSRVKKKIGEKRKIVRFAQTVKEIPDFPMG